MLLGSLQDQVIYPDSVEDMHYSDADLEQLEAVLNIVCLQQIIVKRKGSWDVEGDWKDIFSGGEEQKMEWPGYFTTSKGKLIQI